MVHPSPNLRGGATFLCFSLPHLFCSRLLIAGYRFEGWREEQEDQKNRSQIRWYLSQAPCQGSFSLSLSLHLTLIVSLFIGWCVFSFTASLFEGREATSMLWYWSASSWAKSTSHLYLFPDWFVSWRERYLISLISALELLLALWMIIRDWLDCTIFELLGKKRRRRIVNIWNAMMSSNSNCGDFVFIIFLLRFILLVFSIGE